MVVYWRGGVLPSEIQRLAEESDTRVAVRSCPYTARDLDRAVEFVVDRWPRLTFTLLGVERLPGAAGVRVAVAEPELSHGIEYFDAHPLLQSDGLPLHVEVVPTGYAALHVFPLHPRPVAELARIDTARYIGLPVDEATLRATGDGWLVRSYPYNSGALLTLELRRDRVNLCHDRDGRVTTAEAG